MIDNFQQTFPRAKAYQGMIAVMAGVLSMVQYGLKPDYSGQINLAAGLVLLSMWPYTIWCIMPTNYQLMDGDGIYYVKK